VVNPASALIIKGALGTTLTASTAATPSLDGVPAASVVVIMHENPLTMIIMSIAATITLDIFILRPPKKDDSHYNWHLK
jgi:hypothetical protein